jgi:hypothetical protein
MNVKANTPSQLVKKLQSIFGFKEEDTIILYRTAENETYDKLPKSFSDRFPLKIQIMIVDN